MEASNETTNLNPSWINHEFVEHALRNKERKSVTVDSLTVQRVNVAGTGYMSQMFRVSASIKNENGSGMQSVSIIVKAALALGAAKQNMVDNCQAYRNESVLLYEVMPQLYDSLRAVEGEAFRPLAAECYRWGTEPAEFLVLEDLSAPGFQMAAQGRPLDYHHCSVVLRVYARLHAASALLLKKRPHYKDTFAVNLQTNDGMQEYSRAFNAKLFGQLAKELANHPGYEKYAQKYAKLAERCLDGSESLDAYRRHKSKLPVLLHGDCWKNNFMFKYVDGEVTDVRLVDFQGTAVLGPAADLQYFLFANASEEVHRHKLSHLIEEYHGTLTQLLRRLGLEQEAEQYTLQEFQREMEAYSIAAMCFSAMSAFVLTSETLSEEFTKFFNDPEQFDEALEKAFKNPCSLSYLKYLAPIFDKKGLLTD